MGKYLRTRIIRIILLASSVSLDLSPARRCELCAEQLPFRRRDMLNQDFSTITTKDPDTLVAIRCTWGRIFAFV
jgi:hypothetical protein